jgi:hypothetical protein
MKPSNASTTTSIRTVNLMILFAALAIVATTVGCSNSKAAVSSSLPTGISLQGDAPQPSTAAPSAVVPTTGAKTSLTEKPVAKPVTYKSRDYGVSFTYPWQYAYVNARTIAESDADASLRPKSDGNDAQITLARIDIPKGFYAGTDFESGYFTMSLDQDITSQEECDATFNLAKGGKVETDTINGAEFHWIDTETAGGGKATKLRQYVTFTNNTCYEFEMGVNTRNQDGLAREVNPDQVMRHLDGILRTVTIAPDQSPVKTADETPAPDAKAAAHN